MPYATDEISSVGFDLTYFPTDDNPDGVTEEITVSPLAVIQAEDHFKKGFGELLDSNRVGYLLYLAWRQLRVERPGASPVDYNKFVATVAKIGIVLDRHLKPDEVDEDGNVDPTEPESATG